MCSEPESAGHASRHPVLRGQPVAIYAAEARQYDSLAASPDLERIPDETIILNFRRLLEKHELAAGILGVINGYLGDRGLSLVVEVNLVTDLPAVHRFSKAVLTGRRVPGIKQELVQGLGGCGFQRSIIPDKTEFHVWDRI